MARVRSQHGEFQKYQSLIAQLGSGRALETTVASPTLSVASLPNVFIIVGLLCQNIKNGNSRKGGAGVFIPVISCYSVNL